MKIITVFLSAVISSLVFGSDYNYLILKTNRSMPSTFCALLRFCPFYFFWDRASQTMKITQLMKMVRPASVATTTSNQGTAGGSPSRNSTMTGKKLT
ncbi:MAG: hypothetical protein AAF585_01755 [Verrucomicrobiota bacterium]